MFARRQIAPGIEMASLEIRTHSRVVLINQISAFRRRVEKEGLQFSELDPTSLAIAKRLLPGEVIPISGVESLRKHFKGSTDVDFALEFANQGDPERTKYFLCMLLI